MTFGNMCQRNGEPVIVVGNVGAFVFMMTRQMTVVTMIAFVVVVERNSHRGMSCSDI